MPTKKKTSKTTKNKEKEMEKQIESLENKIKALERQEELNKLIEEEEERRQKAINEKTDIIRNDLNEQLLSQHKYGKQFEDMVEDYIFFVILKENLQNDIRDKGLRYKATTGNGYITEKPNESVKNLKDINAQMLKILQDLELKAPEEGPKVGDEGDDLL